MAPGHQQTSRSPQGQDTGPHPGQADTLHTAPALPAHRPPQGPGTLTRCVPGAVCPQWPAPAHGPHLLWPSQPVPSSLQRPEARPGCPSHLQGRSPHPPHENLPGPGRPAARQPVLRAVLHSVRLSRHERGFPCARFLQRKPASPSFPEPPSLHEAEPPAPCARTQRHSALSSRARAQTEGPHSRTARLWWTQALRNRPKSTPRGPSLRPLRVGVAFVRQGYPPPHRPS